MRVLVCGSRTITDMKLISSKLKEVFQALVKEDPKRTYIVITGGADGPDSIAHRWAERQRKKTHFIVDTEVYPAKWERKDGTIDRGAGYKRNRQMIDSGIDLVIAFHDGASNGTAHTMDLAKRCGIKVIVCKP